MGEVVRQDPPARQTQASKSDSKGTISLTLPLAFLPATDYPVKVGPSKMAGDGNGRSTTLERGGSALPDKTAGRSAGGLRGPAGPGTEGGIWGVQHPGVAPQSPGGEVNATSPRPTSHGAPRAKGAVELGALTWLYSPPSGVQTTQRS